MFSEFQPADLQMNWGTELVSKPELAVLMKGRFSQHLSLFHLE